MSTLLRLILKKRWKSPAATPTLSGSMSRPLFTRPLAFALLSLAAAPVTARGDEAVRLATLRETIASIVDVQTRASQELRDWEARKATMADLLDLHRREIELLSEELGESGRSAPGHDDSVTEARDEIAALGEARARVADAVSRARPRMLALAGRFPAPLADDCRSELATLAAWEPGGEPRDALQPMLGVLAKAAQFNRRISRAMATVEGREVEVLHLGLARAFYADRGGNAGIGLPAADGWQWRPDPTLNRAILRAFEILDQKRPPTRVELPLHIE